MNGATLTRRAFIASAAVLAAGCLRNDPTGRIRLAAGDPGGLYLAFAELLATQVRARYPGVVVDVLPTEGSVENLALLRSGAADLGLALADVAERDRATGAAGTAPSAIARVYENYLQVIVRESTDVHDISGLAGKRISIGPDGSGGAATSRVLFAAAGLDGRIELKALRLKDALARLADGGLDALIWSGGVPTPANLRTGRRRPVADCGHRLAGQPDERDLRLFLCSSPGADLRLRARRNPVDRRAQPPVVPAEHRE